MLHRRRDFNSRLGSQWKYLIMVGPASTTTETQKFVAAVNGRMLQIPAPFAFAVDAVNAVFQYLCDINTD
jgi:hypothetical protein